MNDLELTATETSGVAAISIGMIFLTSGMIIPGIAAVIIGAGLLGLYHVVGIEGIELEDEQIREMAEESEDVYDDVRDRLE